MSSTLMNSVRQFLASHHMYVVDDWLSGCVEYLSEDSENNYSEAEIKNLAKEQWLLNDLKEICPGSLPANLKGQMKTVLTGRFVLQINAVIDIDTYKYVSNSGLNDITLYWAQPISTDGTVVANKPVIVVIDQPARRTMIVYVNIPHDKTSLGQRKRNKKNMLQFKSGSPAYQQYLKLQKVNMENVEATTNYEDKVSSHRMIKLYLTDGVQEIAALEYKPMRNLSCDITPGCKVLIKGPVDCRRGQLLLTESAIELLGGEVQEIAISNSLAGQLSTKLGLPMTQELDPNTTISVPRNTNIPTPHTQMPAAYVQPATFDQTPQQPTLDDQPNNFADDEIDVDQLAALEEQLIDNNPGKRQLATDNTNPEKKLKTTVNNDEYPDENDIFLAEDEDYLRELESQIDAGYTDVISPQNTGPHTVSSEPFVYIKQIKDMNESDKVGKVFKVKGQVMSLLSKLSVSKEGWSLKCTIVDGTGNLDVEFTSEVLSKLVGYSPQEMNAIKRQMATKPELKQKAITALQKAKDSLQVLYCIIELTLQEVPKITNLIPFDASHIEQLNRRSLIS